MNDIKAHAWFRGVDWHSVVTRQIPSPWSPNVKGELDTHYFEHYPETDERYDLLNDAEQELFVDF